MELLITKGDKAARVVLTQGLGPVDFLKLQDGIVLPLMGISIPSGAMIREIRMILEGSGHYATRLDGSICEMQTPSGQQFGVKLKFSSPLLVEGGFSYGMVVDFDVTKSVVQKGNGGCLLKPVLKIKQVARIVPPPPTPMPGPQTTTTVVSTTTTTIVGDPGTLPPASEVIIPVGDTQSGDATGFDTIVPTTPTTQPPAVEVPPSDLINFLSF